MLAALALLGAPVAAQAQDTAPSAESIAAEATEAALFDAADIEATLAKVYASISGPAGQERDWDAMRALFTPDARLTAITPNGLNGGTVDDYIERSGAFLTERGFTESALVNRIEIYGDLAHAWSSYAGTWTDAEGAEQSVRGINSFQLVRQDDGRWLVQSIFWQAETPDNPLPADMVARP